jgi:hypothetical protein
METIVGRLEHARQTDEPDDGFAINKDCNDQESSTFFYNHYPEATAGTFGDDRSFCVAMTINMMTREQGMSEVRSSVTIPARGFVQVIGRATLVRGDRPTINADLIGAIVEAPQPCR